MARNPFRGSFSLRSPKPAAAARKPPIGLKAVAGGSEGVGIVKAIRHGTEYGRLDSARAKLAEVTIQFGEDPKPRKKSDTPTYHDEPHRSTFTVPTAHAQGLAIGDRVRVSIEKVSA